MGLFVCGPWGQEGDQRQLVSAPCLADLACPASDWPGRPVPGWPESGWWPRWAGPGLGLAELAGLSLADPGHNQVQLGWLASVWLAWPGRGRLFLACAWPAWAKPWGALGGPSDAENSM